MKYLFLYKHNLQYKIGNIICVKYFYKQRPSFYFWLVGSFRILWNWILCFDTKSDTTKQYLQALIHFLIQTQCFWIRIFKLNLRCLTSHLFTLKTKNFIGFIWKKFLRLLLFCCIPPPLISTKTHFNLIFIFHFKNERTEVPTFFARKKVNKK